MDPSLLNDTYIPDSTDSEIATYSSVTYKAAGPCKEAGECTGSSAIVVAIGEPGMEITIDKKVSVANIKQSSYSVSDKSISAVVGFSVTNSTSLSIKAKYPIPSKHNNKKVKKVKLYVYPVFQKFSFSI